MIILLVIILILTVILIGLGTYLIFKQREEIRKLETNADDFRSKWELERIAHTAARHSHIAELRESTDFSRQIETFHLQNEAALTDELRRAHAMVEMLLNAGVDEDFKLTRAKARHLFAV